MTRNYLLKAFAWLFCMVLSQVCSAQAGSYIPDFSEGSTGFQESELSNHAQTSSLDLGHPSGLIAVPESTQYLLWAELAEGKLHLLTQEPDKRFRRLKTIPISIGKQGYGKEVEGDKRTPVGIYRVTSYIPESELTDKYGLGAYPVNYPNNWDRLNKRTGYGIWLHGLPKGVDQRPLLDSDGCVVVDNTSLTYLDNFITTGDTLVVLANELEWVSADSANAMSSPVTEAIATWLESWESLDAAAYLDNYHPEFSDFNRDLKAWGEYKTRINQRKSFIKVSLSDLSAFQYPGAEGLVISRFYQDYQSSNYNWAGWKELLWKKDSDGRWKILFEGNG